MLPWSNSRSFSISICDRLSDHSTALGDSEEAHQQVYSGDDGGYGNNQAKFSHELIAGAASFEGFKLFEDHQRKEGGSIQSPKVACLHD